MTKIGVGVIGASPLRPGWAVLAHLPAIAALDDYELRAVATSSEASASAARDAYGVMAFSDPLQLIASTDVDLVVVAVKLSEHNKLVTAAIEAGKMVMCEWPLGVHVPRSGELASKAATSHLATFIGLQARMAASIRYARHLVEHDAHWVRHCVERHRQ